MPNLQLFAVLRDPSQCTTGFATLPREESVVRFRGFVTTGYWHEHRNILTNKDFP